MRHLLLLLTTTMICGCVWHPRTPDSEAPKWAKLASTDAVCSYERSVGSNRKVKRCVSKEQALLEQESGQAFLRKHQEPKSLLKEQRPRGQ